LKLPPKKTSFIFTVVLMLLLCTVSSGCRPGEITPPEREEEGASPSVPPEIDVGEGKEPQLSVYIAESGAVEVMPMEEYIAGVVAGEMDPNWPLDALAAQAIIARTFTLQKIAETGGVPHRNAHASTDIEEFQAYSAEKINSTVREAVNKTRGEVACYKNQFIRAWFSAYAGPRTARADEGLNFEGGNPPYIQIVDSPGKEIVTPEEANWSAGFSLEKVREVVKETTGQDPGPVEQVEIKEKGPSGRVDTFVVNDREISGPGMRLGLGSTEMRSTFVEEMSIEGGMLKMSGTGYGHGVGMCQWGAKALAEEGKSPEDIVNYFYRDIHIVTLWD